MELKKKIFFQFGDDHCEFRSIQENDVTQKYVDGLRRQDRFLQNIPQEVTIDKQKDYIKTIKESPADIICGLFVNRVLVGTSGAQGVSEETDITIGIFLFDPDIRGKGYGKVIIWAMCYLINQSFGYSAFLAKAEKENIASWKSFLGCGFKKFDADNNAYLLRYRGCDITIPNFISDVRIQ